MSARHGCGHHLNTFAWLASLLALLCFASLGFALLACLACLLALLAFLPCLPCLPACLPFFFFYAVCGVRLCADVACWLAGAHVYTLGARHNAVRESQQSAYALVCVCAFLAVPVRRSARCLCFALFFLWRRVRMLHVFLCRSFGNLPQQCLNNAQRLQPKPTPNHPNHNPEPTPH